MFLYSCMHADNHTECGSQAACHEATPIWEEYGMYWLNWRHKERKQLTKKPLQQLRRKSSKPPSHLRVQQAESTSKPQMAQAFSVDQNWHIWADRDILLHRTAWLNDNLLSAAQALLKDQAPNIGGLQLLCASQMCAFDIEEDEFVKILHNGHGHWLTVSTTVAQQGAEVYVYDSMYPSVVEMDNYLIIVKLWLS